MYYSSLGRNKTMSDRYLMKLQGKQQTEAIIDAMGKDTRFDYDRTKFVHFHSY